MTGKNQFVKEAIYWCWSSSANAPTIALILSDSEHKLTTDVLIEGQKIVKPKCDLYDTRENCERAHTITKNWHARQAQLDVAKKLFPVQALPDGAIPYYLDKSEESQDD